MRAVNASVLDGTAATFLANAAGHTALSSVSIGSTFVFARITSSSNAGWFYALHANAGDASGQFIVKDKGEGTNSSDIFGVVRTGLRASGRDIDAP